MKIAIANAKGGVGKTTTAVFLAAAACMRGYAARVWDADIQASASLWADQAAAIGSALGFEVTPANRSTLMKPTADDELVFIDLPPAGDIMVQALSVADIVIVPMSDTVMDYQQTWITMHNIPEGTLKRILLTRAEENTSAFKNLVTALGQQRLERFDAVIRKRQPLKLAVGTKPTKLFEYSDVLTQLLDMTKTRQA
ncbi:ParA family protein [Alloscardovia omnicolens]|uniref:ParA family protein n=1 Tax=Alloscardovia omnicolens TaxID=419015 RepID=UPI00254D8AC3|nr:ParA family protein [Alloscardovia omnicolens]MDK6327202.1 ParA family protein [Alloscardovia omnicolens]MDK8082043.1 ParA family protein [Alloscardovia omnicolens]